MPSVSEIFKLLPYLIWLLAGVGVFIVGMNFMGDALEKSAGGGMKKLLGKIAIGNAGVNPLAVRRVIVNDSQIVVTAPKSTIRSGKKAEVKVDITTAATDEPAQYSRIMTLITNDPNTPVVNVKLIWNVVK